MMIEASCHCGTVRIRLAARPDQITSCNCSLCRRVGALWAYYQPGQVTITAKAGSTVAYVQGERTLGMHHCRTCGCVTHWESLRPDVERMAVNARLMEPADIADVRVRHFDGASTWTYLD